MFLEQQIKSLHLLFCLTCKDGQSRGQFMYFTKYFSEILTQNVAELNESVQDLKTQSVTSNVLQMADLTQTQRELLVEGLAQ